MPFNGAAGIYGGRRGGAGGNWLDDFLTPPLQQFTLGVNYSGFEGGNVIPGVPSFDYSIASPEHFAYYAAKGFNHIRIPAKWERLQGSLNGPLEMPYLNLVLDAVRYAEDNGLKVTFDVHNYGGHSGEKIGGGVVTAAHIADLWSKLSAILKNHPAITAYDLMNEPSNMPNVDAWKIGAQAAIYAIRQNDPHTTILVEGNGYSSAYNWLANGNDNLRTLVDPGGNLVFSAHCYMDRDNSGSHFNWSEEVAAGDELDGGATLDTNIGVKRISVFEQWVNGNDLRGNIGELGAGFNEPGWLEALDNALAYCQSHGITVTYWNSGPYYDTYPYSVGLGNLPEHRQVAVITKYTGAPSVLRYTLDGPAYGLPDEESEVFTVDCRGLITESITITPNDGGQGGVFDPATITMPPGFNGVATFTYTPNDEKVYAISVTNNRGLANPPPIGYATIEDLFDTAGAAVTNILWLSKLKANYLGPCLRLRRSSDNAQSDFNFTTIQLDAPLDVAAITTWAGGSNLYLVKWYDQSGNGYHAAPPASVDTSPGTNADQPQFILAGQNGKPIIRWDVNRMDMTSPLNGLTGWTILTALKPVVYDPSSKLSWALVENYSFPDAGYFQMENQAEMRLYLEAGEWHTHFARFRAATTNGLQTYKDGIVAQQTNSKGSVTSIVFQHRNVVNLGYFKYGYLPFQGDDIGTIIFAGAVTEDAIEAFHNRMADEYDLPEMAEYPTFATPPTPVPTDPTPLPHVGVNLAGMEFGGAAFYPTAAEAAYYYSRGFNSVRLPIDWQRIQAPLGAALNTTHLNNIKTVVNNMTNAGLEAIIDLHDYGKYGANPINAAGGPTYAQFAELWRLLAAEFKTNPKVSFDLMNEPISVNAQTMATASQAAITAIRAEGFTGWIHVEGGGSYAAAAAFVSTGAGTYGIGLTDPLNKLIFHVHCYLDSDSSGTHDTAINGKGTWVLNDITGYARVNGLRLFVGEFGIGYTPSGLTENAAMMDFMKANNDVWVGWSAWGGGPAWGETYFFKLDPAGFAAPIVDKPQTVLLTQHTLYPTVVPANKVSPVITGNLGIGDVLTVSKGQWTEYPTTFSYQWLRDGVNIVGQTANTYTIQIADDDTEITCKVTATNGFGSSIPRESGGKAVGGSTFLPSDIANLAVWYDASDTASITQTAGAVSQWADKSGNNRHAVQNTAIAQPTTGTRTINGLNAIDFDGTISFIRPQIGFSIPSAANTVISVFKTDDSNREMVVITGMIGGSMTWKQILGNVGGRYYIGTNGSGTAEANRKDDTNAHIGGMRYKGTGLGITAFCDGSVTETAGGTNSTVTNGYVIGRDDGASGRTYFDGLIAEVLIYTAALTDDQINEIGQYLAAKWNIAWIAL